jgi:hypothetical protein
MSGGAGRDQRLAQCGARSIEIGAVGSLLDDGFDGESFHDIHRS